MAEAASPEALDGIAAATAVDGDLHCPVFKRQRRPSVRLGDIGEQLATIPQEPYVRRRKKRKHSATVGKDHPAHPPSSKERSVASPDSDGSLDALGFCQADGSVLPLDEDLPISVAIRRSRDAKSRRRGVKGKLGRSSWASSKIEEGIDATAVESKESLDEGAGEEGFREFDELLAEDSESPPHSKGAALRVRVSKSYDVGHSGDAMEGDVPSQDNDGDWNGQNGCGLVEDGGVRAWLSRLGLDRYAPVFEIHEVDDEVLPWLMMDDLKDMGITAVGSRRKIYCAIQKLKKRLLGVSLHEECC